jgi:hypothetical protein
VGLRVLEPANFMRPFKISGSRALPTSPPFATASPPYQARSPRAAAGEGMANKATAATSWRWRLLLLLLVAVAALCWIPPAIAAAAAAASTASGARRSLLGFVEAQGNASYQCTPSGPCIPCQYSEKVRRFYLFLVGLRAYRIGVFLWRKTNRSSLVIQRFLR